MNETNVENNQSSDSKKIITLVVLILTIMVCTTSATYAYFAINATNNNTISGQAASGSLVLTVTQAALKTTSNTGVMVPQNQTALSKAMDSTNKCIDGNSNIICKVYTIKIQNNSTANVLLNGAIQFSGNTSMPNLYWRKTTDATVLGSNKSVSVMQKVDNSNVYDTVFDLPSANGTACQLTSGGTTSVGTGCTSINVAKGSSAIYNIVIWINETGSSQTDSGTWKATVTFQGKDGTGITSTITS